MLERFPERTHPFWNMKNNNGIFNKIDVILCGQETIGSAERSCNIDEMLYSFNHVSDGAYRDKLYELFGEDRVNKELDDFFKLKFIPRFGGGIGVNRMARALNIINDDLPF
jgi:aspartyl/asparaginyl-tRNA synthetase